MRAEADQKAPDLELSGPALGDGYWAVDIKCEMCETQESEAAE